MENHISINEARQLIIHSQKLYESSQTNKSTDLTLHTIEHLGYIQIDTISVIERAHHHTLWNRNAKYNHLDLELLLKEKKVFEYWSHAASYLPMRDYKYTLPRKLSLKKGEQKHWYEKDERLIKYILERISKEGPLMAKDFEDHGYKSKGWGGKPAKRMLEYLFMQGDLMIPSRVNFHKVYDLTQRVLPKDIDINIPTQKEYAYFLITNYLKANGVGKEIEMTYLLKNIKAQVKELLKDMIDNKELLKINIKKETYYTLPKSLELINKPIQKNKAKILSPFDNLLIQRKRMQSLFSYDYKIECYTPERKREYGYFSLPVLLDTNLVARMDCKVDRKKSILHIYHIALESSLNEIESFAQALVKELRNFLTFNKCNEIKLHKITPNCSKFILENELKRLNRL